MSDLLDELNLANPVTPEELQAAEAALKFSLPDDYQDIILWKVSELAQFNLEYQFPVYAPDFVAFASSGGGDAFAFDTRMNPPPIVEVPFIGMSHEDGLRVADNFGHLLQRMRETPGSLF